MHVPPSVRPIVPHQPEENTPPISAPLTLNPELRMQLQPFLSPSLTAFLKLLLLSGGSGTRAPLEVQPPKKRKKKKSGFNL